MGVSRVDTIRRSEMERRVTRGIMEGMDEGEICELLGIGGGDLSRLLRDVSRRVQRSSIEVARHQAIDQTVRLMMLYSRLESSLGDYIDVRVVGEMRGILSDIRKIWGVESASKISVDGNVIVNNGVIGGVLGVLDERTLERLEGAFKRFESGAGSDGEGLSEVAGVCEVSESI